MRNFFTKKTFTSATLSFLVFVMLLAPVSVQLPKFTHTDNENEISVMLPAVAYAADTDTKGAQTKKAAEDSSLAGYIAKAIFDWLGNAILQIVSSITWLAGLSLEKATEELVFKMGAWTNGESFGAAIDTAWMIIRDICNLFFIFGFIYTGIRTIIDPEAAETKRFLSKIIIGALLINFSLFIVKIVIDFSNFTAIQIFNAMTTGSGSLSARVADMLGLVSIFQVSDPQTLARVTGGGMIWFYILAAVFLLIAAFIFAAGAILLVTRFVVLIFIMVFSPILFAATVFPQTEHYASDLWHKLFSYSFFAPAYFLFMLIAMTLLSGLPMAGKSGNLYKAITSGITSDAPTGVFGVILFFFIATGFFILALISAQQLGVQGGEMMVNLGKKTAAFTGNKALRYGSLKVRQFEGAEHGEEHGDFSWRKFSTWKVASRLGSSDIGHKIKQTPLLIPLQAMGHKVVHDLDEAKKHSAGKRSQEYHEELAMIHRKDPRTKWATAVARYAAYEGVKANGDLDELTPEQCRDYMSILTEYGLGKTFLRLARPDIFDHKRKGETGPIQYTFDKPKDDKDFKFNASAMDKAVLKGKKSSDVGEEKLHKITLTLDGTGADEYDKNGKIDPEKRKDSVKALKRSYVQLGSGSMFQGFSGRGDIVGAEIKDAVREAIIEWRAKTKQTFTDDQLKTDASIYEAFFKDQAGIAEEKAGLARKAWEKARKDGKEHLEKEIREDLVLWEEAKNRAIGKAEVFGTPQRARAWGIEPKGSKAEKNGQQKSSNNTSAPPPTINPDILNETGED